MNKRGVGFDEYIANCSQKPKKMPLYMIKVEGVTHYGTSDKKLAKLTKGDEEANYAGIF
ncbi:hypothetical protein IH922_10065 [candidate division KSB1 bacterium]|nr:hypothetical protein [candidate division KSB1 bacterium]